MKILSKRATFSNTLLESLCGFAFVFISLLIISLYFIKEVKIELVQVLLAMIVMYIPVVVIVHICKILTSSRQDVFWLVDKSGIVAFKGGKIARKASWKDVRNITWKKNRLSVLLNNPNGFLVLPRVSKDTWIELLKFRETIK